MDLIHPDFLYPIGDDNRKENIVVEFHRLFKNTNLGLLRNLFKYAAKDPELLSILPGLLDYRGFDLGKMYFKTVLYNYPKDMVYDLAKGKISMEQCEQIADEFMYPIGLARLHHTRLEMVLFKLLQKEFVENIYILANKWTKEMAAYVLTAFGRSFGGYDNDPQRVHIMHGELLDFLQDYPKTTTCFINSSEEFFNVEKANRDLISGKYFIIGDGYADYIPKNNETGEVEYAHLSEFNEYAKKKVCALAYMFPYPIEFERKE